MYFLHLFNAIQDKKIINNHDGFGAWYSNQMEILTVLLDYWINSG